MAREDNTTYSRNFLIVSILLNILLATVAGFTIWNGMDQRGQIEELSYSYNTLAESYRSLEEQLNMTRNQLNYYKEQAEYYSVFPAQGNATAGIIGQVSIPIVAVHTIQRGFQVQYQGVIMRAELELIEGKGRILINTIPKIGIDIQTSMRTAVMVSEEVTGISLSKTDVVLTLLANQDVEIIDGPSAGAAITVALIAAIRNQGLNQSIYMTGTISSDGSVGPIGGIPEKALAAAENGSKCFLVPEGQSSIVVYIPVTKHPAPGWTITTYERKLIHLQDYLEEHGYSVVVEEVDRVEEAYTKFIMHA